MQYMLLLYNDETAWAALSDDERGEIVGQYFAFSRQCPHEGVDLALGELRDCRIRCVNGWKSTGAIRRAPRAIR